MRLRQLTGLIGLLAALALLPGPSGMVYAQDESWLIGQANALRASVGLGGLAPNAQLNAAAAQHSTYMATTCDVSHTESNGSTPMSRAQANGYAGSRVNENIYGGANATANSAWSFWVNSGVHYQAMIDGRINEIGVGVASGPCGHFFTMLVGTNGSAAPPPDLPQADAPAEAAPAADEGPPAEAAQEVAAAPPATERPYVPPPPSRTPTPTILTLTPSATWTITPTYTVSPTGTRQPPTATPIILPTVPAPGQRVAAAASASPTAEPSRTPSATPSATPLPVIEQQAVGGDGMTMRDLLPVALAGQIVLIGLVGFAYFRRQHR